MTFNLIFKITTLIMFVSLLQSCGQTLDECLKDAIKDSPTEIALRLAAAECAIEHKDD